MAAKTGAKAAPKKKECKICGFKDTPDTLKFCGSCGAPFSGVPKSVSFNLEANAVGDNGHFNIEVQASKNGEGIKDASVAFLRTRDLSQVNYLTANPDGHCIVPNVTVVGKWEGFLFRHQLAEKWLWLAGPKYDRPQNQGFMQEYRAIVQHHGGRSSFVVYALVLSLFIGLLMAKGGLTTVVILGQALAILAVAGAVVIAFNAFRVQLSGNRRPQVSLRSSGYLGYLAGQFASNNNYRWLITAGLFMILLFQALVVGPGGPILSQAIDWLYTSAAAWSNTAYTPTNYTGYPSWWWWMMVPIWFMFLMVHTVLAFSDEFAEVWRKAYNAAVNKKQGKSEHKTPDAAGKSSSSGWTFGKDFFSDMLAEGIWEIPKLIYAGFGR